MDLAHRNHLWLLMLLPPLLALAGRCARRRAGQWVSLGQGGRMRGDGAIAWIGAIACLIVALAQPRWGRIPAPPLPPGRDVVLLMDDSRSMAVEDAVPDRLGLAVDAASSLVNALGRQPGNRVAVVAFAGRGVLRCPLTENLGAVSDTLHTLRPADVRPGGTDLGAGLTTALGAFGNREHEPEQSGGRTIVVFSDGEDHIGSSDVAVQRLREAGIVVHAVAVGDAERGHPVPLAHGAGSLEYEGEPVLSRRSDAALAAIAEATGGALLALGLAAADLGDLYLKRIDPIARQKRIAFRSSERAERYSWFVFAALVLGLAGSWPGYRGTDLRAGRFLRRVGLLAAVGLAAGAAKESGESEAAMNAAQAVEMGRTAYAAGRWAEALTAFERAAAFEPRAAVPRYDIAATLFRMQRYADAAEAYTMARQTAGVVLRTKIDFTLGNTALALGDVHAAIAHYDACIASQSEGPELDAVRGDAAVNRHFAVESAQRTPAPPRSEGGSPNAPQSRRPSGSERENNGSPDGQTPGSAVGAEGPGQGTPGRRGRGGAGGSGAAQPEGGSPEERLDSALERVRAARHHRLPEEPSSAPSGKDRKEW